MLQVDPCNTTLKSVLYDWCIFFKKRNLKLINAAELQDFKHNVTFFKSNEIQLDVSWGQSYEAGHHS